MRKGSEEEYDGPDQAAELEFRKTMDPALGYVPAERLLDAFETTQQLQLSASSFISSYGDWTERGPYRDAAGPDNANTRANNAVTSGRVRAILVDASDPSGKTVFVGSAAGGLWKTTDITANPTNWQLISDFLPNMSISDICQDPVYPNMLYMCTGEPYYNGDGVRGAGAFKSFDHGATWISLGGPNYNHSFDYCSRILLDQSRNIYVATRDGLFRSTTSGASFTDITPAGISRRICDLEISSTGRLHLVAGIFSAQAYRYTDTCSTVNPNGWTSPVTPFPSYNMRAEIGVSGNTLYACPVNEANLVPAIYKSTDGGANWAVTGGQPSNANWTSSQGWYALSVVVNPANANQCIIGGLDNWKTTNGGTSWSNISTWVGTFGQYAHADQHKAVWYSGNKLIFGSDGGIFYSADGGTTIRDRNIGLRIKQFYSCAVHPTNLNYFLAGAQDNGTHAFNAAGLGATVEVKGGDGGFVHIDQDQPQYQFTSTIYQKYYVSDDGGANWEPYELSYTNTGEFINPTDYDNSTNIMYCANEAGSYRRWLYPQLSSSYNEVVDINAMGTGRVEAVTVSPYIANRVYFGTDQGKVLYVDNANTVASGSAGTLISNGLPNAFTSCVAIGSNSQNLMVSYSNYGVQHVWISRNGGASWANINGNLPDMPVRWCMFAPNDNNKAIIATETGVWLTQSINGIFTNWIPSPGFPRVRTDMLQYRPADQLIAAATHARGLWTQNAFSVLPLNNFHLQGKWSGNNAELNWTYNDLPAGSRFEIESSADANHFTKLGTVMRSSESSYGYNNPSAGNLFYRIKGIDNNGIAKYSNVVKLFRNESSAGSLQIVKLYPNPLRDGLLRVDFSVTEKGRAVYVITNTAGQVIWKNEEELSRTGSHRITADLSSLKAGTYVFTVTINGKKASQVFIK